MGQEPPVLFLLVCCIGMFTTLTFGGVVYERLRRPILTIVISVLWFIAVFIPLAAWDFGGRKAFFVSIIGVYDYAGAIPFFLGLGSAAWITIVLSPKSEPEGLHFFRTRTKQIVTIFTLIVLWIGWLVATEMEINFYSLSIVSNSVVISFAAIGSSLAVDRLKHRQVGLESVGIGVLSGLAAATAVGPYIHILAAAGLGVVAGAVASVSVHRRSGHNVPSFGRFVSITAITGSSIGLVMLGLFDQARGFFYTGSPQLSYSQLLGTVIGMLFSIVVTAVLLVAVRSLSSSRQFNGSTSDELPTIGQLEVDNGDQTPVERNSRNCAS